MTTSGAKSLDDTQKTKPGRRDELKRFFETLMAEMGPSLKEKGSLGSTLYAVLDDPDLLVEIADWESAEAHEAVMRDPATAEALAPVLELLVSPFKAMILREPDVVRWPHNNHGRD